MSMRRSAVATIIDVAVEQARGPLNVDRLAAVPPAGAETYGSPLTGTDQSGKHFHIFVPGIDRVGDPEAVIGHAD